MSDTMSDTTCPSCGAPVELKLGASVCVICPYCDTPLVRKDRKLEDIGQKSNLVDDATPICLGARGTFEGRGFEVVGRLQLEHSVGYWNEWYLLFDDDETGWLGEAAGEYFITFPVGEDALADVHKRVGRVLERDEMLEGLHVKIGKRRFTVTDARSSRCTGGQGELPFVVGKGYEFEYADLRRPDGAFATIDLSEDPPLVFAGRAVTWDELDMKGHRTFDGWD